MYTVDFLMKRDNIMPRLNQQVLSTADNPVINLIGQSQPLDSATFTSLNKKSQAASFSKQACYLVGKEAVKMSKLRMVTVWVAADMETEVGRHTVLAAVAHVKTTNQVRVWIIHNTGKPGLLSRVVEAAIISLDSSEAISVISKVLKPSTATKLVSGKKKLYDFDIPGVEMSEFIKTVEELSEEVFMFI